MKTMKRGLVLLFVLALVLNCFPAALAAESAAEPTELETEPAVVPETVVPVEPTPVTDLAEETQPPEEEAVPSGAETEETQTTADPPAEAPAIDPPAEEFPAEEPDHETVSRAYVESRGAAFTLNTPGVAMTAAEFAPEDEAMLELCQDQGILAVLDYFLFEIRAEPEIAEGTLEICFDNPSLNTICREMTYLFKITGGEALRMDAAVTVEEQKITALSFPIQDSLSGRYALLTVDQPNPTKELGTIWANMAVNTLGNRRVGLSGNGISFSTSGIIWHYVSDPRKPALCLQPNKTFQSSNSPVYNIESATLSGSGTGSVGGNVWNNLSYDQRRTIGLIALYGVQTHWDNSVGNNGLNTALNLQNLTNPNQCLFAAQQIMVWEVVTGNRGTTAPYTCYDSTLIDAFGGDVPYWYSWLEGQLRAHDSSQDTVPSPEESTYRLAWLSSDYQTVIQVLEVEYVTPTPPEPETAALFIYKMSRNAPDELKYFTFKVFADAGLTRQVGVTQRLHPGAAWCVELEPGVTYYVAEAAEDGWSCTSNVSTRTVDGVKYYYMPVVAVADEHTYVYFYNEPEVKEEPITLEKGIQAEADCIASIQGNPLYSLAGAEYTVSVDGTVSETLVTDASGRAVSTKTYPVGTQLTIRESKSPKGFLLDSSSYHYTVVSGSNMISVKDIPVFDPPFAMTKVDKLTGKPQGDGSFQGAVFKWEYYPNLDWSGSPARTWYFGTNASGRAEYDKSYLASGYTSDPLFAAADGTNQIPLGSVKMTEVKNSLGYLVLEKPLYCQIVQDDSAIGASVRWTEESLKFLVDMATGNYGIYEPVALPGSVTVQKVDADSGKPLAGALFLVVNESEGPVKVGDSGVAAPGEECFTLITDATGMASSGAVFPVGTYSIRELVAPEGYQRDPDWEQHFTVTEEQKDYAFTLDTGKACKNSPIRGGIRITKQDAKLLEATGADAKLEGIRFTVYNENEAPVYAGGKAYSQGEAIAQLELAWDGSAWSAATAPDALPLGSYRVQEEAKEAGSDLANDYYLLNVEGQTVQITEIGVFANAAFVNARRPGKLTVQKVDGNGTPLEGVVFCLLWSRDGTVWQKVISSEQPGQEGCCTAPDIREGCLTTGADGIAAFTGLDPTLHYRVVETETPTGHTLLQEDVFCGLLPQEKPEITFRVVNGQAFRLPETGSISLGLVPAAGAVCFAAALLLLWAGREFPGKKDR